MTQPSDDMSTTTPQWEGPHDELWTPEELAALDTNAMNTNPHHLVKYLFLRDRGYSKKGAIERCREYDATLDQMVEMVCGDGGLAQTVVELQEENDRLRKMRQRTIKTHDAEAFGAGVDSQKRVTEEIAEQRDHFRKNYNELAERHRKLRITLEGANAQLREERDTLFNRLEEMKTIQGRLVRGLRAIRDEKFLDMLEIEEADPVAIAKFLLADLKRS